VFLLKQLPCPNLLELQFLGTGGPLLPDSGAPRLLQAATGLTRLSFDVAGEASDFCPSLVVLRDLRQLRSLRVATLGFSNHPPLGPADALDGAVLAQLPHLTQLQLFGRLRVNTLCHISCLTALQELLVDLDYPVAEAAAASAPQSQPQPQPQALLQHLTKLQLGAPGLLINGSSYPWLAQLPSLLVAEFTYGALDSQVVSAAPQLTKCRLQPAAEVAGSASGLLEFLSSLRSLQQLAVCSLDMHESTREILFPSACSCLTAGASLLDLQLSGLKVPQGGWQHAFPASVQLGLTCLEVTAARGERIDSTDLQRLVQCCPHLKRLSLAHAVQQGKCLQLLTQLPCLDTLFLGGFLFEDPEHPEVRFQEWREAVYYLSELPALKHLEVIRPDILSRTELLRLTGLTRQEWLHVNMYEPTEQLLYKEVRVVLLVRMQGWQQA
jgi:hypothetical protein